LSTKSPSVTCLPVYVAGIFELLNRVSMMRVLCVCCFFAWVGIVARGATLL
jgi:hypothetical protein